MVIEGGPLLENTHISKAVWNESTASNFSRFSSNGTSTHFTPASKVKNIADISIENGECIVKVGEQIEVFTTSLKGIDIGKIPFDTGKKIEIRGFIDNFKGKSGQQAISIHGDTQGNFYFTRQSEAMSAEDLVTYFKKEKIDLTQGNTPIHLLSCYSKSSGAAQALADATGRPVIGYSNRQVRTNSLQHLTETMTRTGSKMSRLDPRRFLAQDDFKPATPRVFYPEGKPSEKLSDANLNTHADSSQSVLSHANQNDSTHYLDIDNGIEFKSTKAGFAQEEEAIKDLFDELSDTPPATKAEYEANSQTRYDVSRNLLPDITGEEKILLRRYGSDGVVINRQVRAYDGDPISLEEANRIFKDEKDYIEGKLRSDQGDEAGKSATVLKTKLDNFIDENYHQFFETEGYVYRASGAKKGLYKNDIQPGNIISDKANWSTSNHFGTIGYRYSSYGEGASITKLASTDEEIWFVIEKENLKGVDISGYKFENNPKLSLEEQRNKSSGEFLLKSDQKFRIKAVEKTSFKILKREKRGRLVLLEPVNSAEMLGSNPNVIDAYNGHKLPVNVNDDFLINTHGSEGKSTLQKMEEGAKKVKDVLLTPVDYPPKSGTKKKIGNSPRYTESTSILDAFSGGNTGIDSDIKGAKDIKLGKNTKTALLGPGHLAGSVLKGFAKP